MKLPPLVHNRLSYAGATIAALAWTAIAFLFIVSTLVGSREAPYAGLVIFILLPVVLLGGLALVPIGILRERRQLRRTGIASIPRFPVIDLNDARQRNLVGIFTVGSVALLFLSVFGSFQAYEATESVAFCGSTCHTVMEPEKVLHQRSPHARVRCVDCHVGSGGDSFVKSKLAGTHQLFALLTDDFPRPIPVPVHGLRPARETCEQCHWREQHADLMRFRQHVYFLPDEANSRWEIGLLVNVGGKLDGGGGVHWHLDADHRVEYIATDEQRQQIPWMRVTDRRSGETTEYNSTENPLSKEQIAAGPVRVMDCLDCHNRPSHKYDAPDEGLDKALLAGDIDASLPSIKQTGYDLLTTDYDSKEQADAAIEAGIRQFYQDNHPDLVESRAADLARATAAIQAIYRGNFFPAMKASWKAYPDNASHLMFPGCVRCHDGLHQNADGAVVAQGCTTCHVITSQGRPGELQTSTDPKGLEFEHPPVPDLGDAWQDTPCTDCHAEQ